MTKKEPLPWFPHRAFEFLADEDISTMTLASVGALMLLRSRQWTQGSIPSDETKIAALLRLDGEDFSDVWSEIGHRFEPLDSDPSRLVDPFLNDDYQASLNMRERQRINGAKGGRPRKTKKPNGKPAGSPKQTQPKPRTEQNRTEQRELIGGLIDYFSEMSGRTFKRDGGQGANMAGRLADGATIEEIKLVADHKSEQWRNDPAMKKYLCPETCYRKTKWENNLLSAQEWRDAGRPTESPSDSKSTVNESPLDLANRLMAGG